jgi:stearoyl-CoA desaturase (delta-9 desaturase)
MENLSNDFKVKAVQAFVYIAALVTVVFAWDTTLFLAALAMGWLLFGFGGSICLHKLSSHRSFVPKNRLIKWFILWCGTIGSLGSTICWAAGHREHHKHSDHAADPHRPLGSLWHKVKMWFYYFPTWKINPMIVKDLLADPDHQFFHRHYYKIIFSYVAILALINPIYVGYFYAIPVMYTLFGISWATVIAHVPQLGYLSWRTYDTDDYTYNSNFWNVILMGEGYHNTHHACPWLWNNALRKCEWDMSAWVIKLIGTPNDIPPRPFNPPRTGKKLREELASVKQRLKDEETNSSPKGAAS